jgi:chemotaxis signal transduction protein
MRPDDATTSGRMLAFRVGSVRYAAPLDGVLAVLGAAEAAPIAAGGPALLYGRPVPVLDAAKAGWGGDAAPTAAGAHAVVIVGRAGGAAVALLVDEVDGMVEDEGRQEMPALVAPFLRGLFRGVIPQTGGALLVLDPEALAAGAGAATGPDGRRGAGEA